MVVKKAHLIDFGQSYTFCRFCSFIGSCFLLLLLWANMRFQFPWHGSIVVVLEEEFCSKFVWISFSFERNGEISLLGFWDLMWKPDSFLEVFWLELRGEVNSQNGFCWREDQSSRRVSRSATNNFAWGNEVAERNAGSLWFVMLTFLFLCYLIYAFLIKLVVCFSLNLKFTGKESIF